MRFKIIKSILLKEMKEISRDKKTLFLIILLPFFMYSIMGFVIQIVMQNQINKIKGTEIVVQITPEVKKTPLYDSLQTQKNYKIELMEHPDSLQKTELKKALSISLTEDYQSELKAEKSVQFQIYYDETDDFSELAQEKVKKFIDNLNEAELDKRLSAKNYEADFVNPVVVESIDTSPQESKIAAMIMKFVPAILLLLITSGVAQITIDLTAGEKERKTLQSIYAAPIKHTEIITGKFLAANSIGITSAIINLAGLAFMFWWVASMGSVGKSLGINLDIPVSDWLIVGGLFMITTTFITALCMAVLILAKSYKEATSYLSPLLLVVMSPLFLLSLPGWELNGTTSLIPILNIVLAMQDILLGKADAGLLLLTFIASIGFCLLALYATVQAFSNESVITGEKINYQALIQTGGKRYFGASEAFLYFALTLLLFLYVGLPIQLKYAEDNLFLGLALSFFLVFGGLSIVTMAYFKMRPKEDLGLKPFNIGSLMGVLLMAVSVWLPVIFITMPFISQEFAEGMQEQFKPIMEAPIWQIALVTLLPGIFEEWVFRGVMFKGLKNDLGKWGTIILTSVGFAVMHLSLERFIPTFSLGLLLGYVMWESRSLWLCMILHYVYDFVLFNLGRMEKEWNLEAILEGQDYWVVGIGTVVAALGFLIFYKSTRNKKVASKPQPEPEKELVA